MIGDKRWLVENSMALEVRSVPAVEGAREVIRRLREHLPQDAKWSLELHDASDAVYYLTIYAHVDNTWDYRDIVRDVLVDLNRRGVAMVLMFDSPESLAYYAGGDFYGLND